MLQDRPAHLRCKCASARPSGRGARGPRSPPRRNPEPRIDVASGVPSDNPGIGTNLSESSMVSIRVGKAAIARSLAGVLLLAGSGLWQPAQAQYRGFGFPFFGNNPWFFGRPAPEPRAPRYRQPREREPANITAPPPPQKSEVTPAKTGIVIGDSMAEWLAYGLEQAYAESADVGVVRKVRQSTGPRAQEAPAVVQEGPGYAQEGSGVVPRSSKPSARGSSRKPGVDALARSRNASARTAPGRPGNCSLVETLRARAEGERPIQSPGWTA